MLLSIYTGNNFCDSLLALLYTKFLLKKVSSLNQRMVGIYYHSTSRQEGSFLEGKNLYCICFPSKIDHF